MRVNGCLAHHLGMIVDIQTRRPRTIGQLCAFIEGNEAVIFQPRDRDGVYNQGKSPYSLTAIFGKVCDSKLKKMRNFQLKLTGRTRWAGSLSG